MSKEIFCCRISEDNEVLDLLKKLDTDTFTLFTNAGVGSATPNQCLAKFIHVASSRTWIVVFKHYNFPDAVDNGYEAYIHTNVDPEDIPTLESMVIEMFDPARSQLIYDSIKN